MTDQTPEVLPAPAESAPSANEEVTQVAAAFSAVSGPESSISSSLQQSTTVAPSVETTAPRDVAMGGDGTEDVAANSPLPAQTSTPAPLTSGASPIPARTGTPMRNAAGANGESSSRAASAHPDPGFAMPSEAPLHGAPVRQYINSKVTGVLLEGMKLVAKEQPRDPLRMLGEFLLQRSKDLEATS